MSRCELFLEPEDFETHISPVKQNKILTYKTSGLSLILFYSKDCKWCPPFLELLKQLPPYINGCQVGKSRISSQNMAFFAGFIKRIPVMILYVDGVPIVSYNGEPNLQHVVTFVNEEARAVLRRRQVENRAPSVYFPAGNPNVNPNSEQAISQRRVAATNLTTIGIPIVGDSKNVCYLVLDATTGSYVCRDTPDYTPYATEESIKQRNQQPSGNIGNYKSYG